MNDECYSQAPRCTPCGERALLSEGLATALVNRSEGRLEVFACLVDDGCHVWAPTFEKLSDPAV